MQEMQDAESLAEARQADHYARQPSETESSTISDPSRLSDADAASSKDQDLTEPSPDASTPSSAPCGGETDDHAGYVAAAAAPGEFKKRDRGSKQQRDIKHKSEGLRRFEGGGTSPGHGHGHGHGHISHAHAHAHGGAMHQIQHRAVEKASFKLLEKVAERMAGHAGERVAEHMTEMLAEQAGERLLAGRAGGLAGPDLAGRAAEAACSHLGACAATRAAGAGAGAGHTAAAAAAALGHGHGGAARHPGILDKAIDAALSFEVVQRAASKAAVARLGQAAAVALPALGAALVAHLAREDWRRASELRRAGSVAAALLLLLAFVADSIDVVAHVFVVVALMHHQFQVGPDISHAALHAVESWGLAVAAVATVAATLGEVLAGRRRRALLAAPCCPAGARGSEAAGGGPGKLHAD